MDKVYIDALVNQALGAYKAGGDEGLVHWKKALPAPHLADFELHCSEPLREAIAALDVVDEGEEEWTAPELLSKHIDSPSKDARKRHTRDQRRTKPL